MTKKVYRTAQGKTVDLGALQLQNENVRAVGNMGVNARGDRVNNRNQSIDNRTQQTTRQYKKQVTNVSDDVVYTSKKAAKEQSTDAVQQSKKIVEDRMQSESELFSVKSTDAEPVTQDPTVDSPVGGLADAIARARTVKQEPLKTPRQLAQEKAGVKKI